MAERRGLSSDFDHLTEHLEQMWEHVLGRGSGGAGNPRFAPPVIEPPTDVYQTHDEIVVLIEIAGMRDQAVEIQLDGRRLTVRGEKLDRRTHSPGRVYNTMEIHYGPFVRVALLPADVDHERAAITYDDGLLQITLPTRARELHRRVRIVVH